METISQKSPFFSVKQLPSPKPLHLVLKLQCLPLYPSSDYPINNSFKPQPAHCFYSKLNLIKGVLTFLFEQCNIFTRNYSLFFSYIRKKCFSVVSFYTIIVINFERYFFLFSWFNVFVHGQSLLARFNCFSKPCSSKVLINKS